MSKTRKTRKELTEDIYWLLENIKLLSNSIDSLEKSIWEVKNPPTFKAGDVVKFKDSETNSEYLILDCYSIFMPFCGYFWYCDLLNIKSKEKHNKILCNRIVLKTKKK